MTEAEARLDWVEDCKWRYCILTTFRKFSFPEKERKRK